MVKRESNSGQIEICPIERDHGRKTLGSRDDGGEQIRLIGVIAHQILFHHKFVPVQIPKPHQEGHRARAPGKSGGFRIEKQAITGALYFKSQRAKPRRVQREKSGFGWHGISPHQQAVSAWARFGCGRGDGAELFQQVRTHASSYFTTGLRAAFTSSTRVIGQV